MSEELLSNLHKRHADAQSKYIYFLLAIAAATIAFAIQRTENTSFSCSLIPVAIAMSFWGYSFYCGIRHILLVNSMVAANIGIVKLRNGVHEMQPEPQFLQSAIDGVKDQVNSNNSLAAGYEKRQLIFIALGAAAYVIAHFLKIYEQTYAT